MLISPNLRAIELNQICQNGSTTSCYINTIYGEVTNNDSFIFGGNNSIQLSTGGSIDTFINYGILSNTGGYERSFYWSGGNISNIINYGTMGGIGGNRSNAMPMSVTNYGFMFGGIDTSWGGADITIDNYGIIGRSSNMGQTRHLAGGSSYSFIIKNYALVITQNTTTFNAFSGNAVDSSQVVLQGGSMRFFDSSAKVILDFGGNFSFGEAYSLDKLFVDMSGNNVLSVPFSRLTTRSELYTLSQSGNNFIVNPADSKTAGYSTIGLLHKSNVKTMNSFYLQSNNVIYPKRHTKRKRTLQRRVIRKRVANVVDDASLRDSALAESWQSTNESSESKWIASGKALAMTSEGLIASYSANTRNDESLALQSNETFFYDSQMYLADTQRTRRTINTTNARNPNQSTNPNANRAIRTTQTTQNNNYYFVLTPFVAHNLFFESGRYNLSGLEYGFITAFGGNISPSNYLGAHFAFSYGSLSDKNDKIFNITSSNMMVGLNYKFNMIWSMYLKARIDAFYFLNQVQSIAVTSGRVIKPNNIGFGASVAYGKEWDFGSGGVLGVEVALDYKGLMSPNILTQNGGDANINESFNKAFYNMLYVDLGLNYDKYFETSVGKWGLDAGLGAKINATANALAKSNIRLNNIRDINMTLDNDMILAYLNVGGSYVLNAKNFDMEFSLAYYGNYGDRTMSNGGGFEWRVVW